MNVVIYIQQIHKQRKHTNSRQGTDQMTNICHKLSWTTKTQYIIGKKEHLLSKQPYRKVTTKQQ